MPLELYDDPRILGHIYAAPYAILAPELAFVLEDEQGVCGYVLGALDSETFYQAMQTQWLPSLKAQVPDPQGDSKAWTASQRLYYQVHHFGKTSLPESLKAYPAHLHIDILPRAQGQGQGRALMKRFLANLKEQGARAVHLGLDPRNQRALAFYQALGFKKIEDEKLKGALYMGKAL
ncbi:MAG: GNAT family N-acetyltransferase [Deinococcales bacterium]